MKKIIRFFKRLYYRIIFEPSQCLLHDHIMFGKFRVKYPDGKISQKFSYKTAKNYSEIFGGKVIDDL